MKKNPSMDRIRSILSKRILILDGAMGTMLQKQNLTEKQFRGDFFKDTEIPLKGNNDVLPLTCPDAVRKVHDSYLEAGADIIETDSFNANSFSQAKYGLADHVYELAKAAATVARASADHYTELTPEKPRFVAGSIGPTGCSCSMSPDVNRPEYRNISFDDLAAAYKTAALGLMDGGADILLIETIFDTLNCKAAIEGIRQACEERQMRMPVMISGTLSDASGRLLAGQSVEAFLISVEHTPDLLSIGFNCALGAAEMRPHIEELARKAPCFISAHPNAGLPDEFGKYRQTPEIMAQIMAEFGDAGLLNIAGGCCGTTPDHIRKIAEVMKGKKPHEIPGHLPSFRLAGLDPLVITKETNFINVGERTNVAGSRKFLNLIKEKNYKEAIRIARSQIENGAQIVDVNMDDAMLDSKDSMSTFLRFYASEPDLAKVPLMIDSSRWDVILEALKQVQGKCVVNSISLKEGEENFLEKARLLRRFGAAALVMAFDEQGQADTPERRIGVCRRSYQLLTEKADFPPEDIIFDPNVFAVATGMPEHDNYAKDFIEAVGAIRKEMPLCRISGGISNVSFSFRGNEPVRQALHSVFLYHAVKNGLDMGIVNPAQLALYENLPEELRKAAEDVILNRCPDAAENLVKAAQGFSKDALRTGSGDTDAWRKESLGKRIEHAMLTGDDSYLKEDMEEAVKAYPDPVVIIEGPLMDGMKQVGKLFGEGKMFLPQVVKSARVMKNAVEQLMPQIRKASGSASSAGTILMATVKGDVHDIGKNIAALVLQCNNYRIIDLGVMVPMQTILDTAEREKVDIIGLSGLITPSLEEMVSIASEMERRGMKIPLILGGAATSEAHTALRAAPAYPSGHVFHAADASRGVLLVNQILNSRTREEFFRKTEERYEFLRKNHREKEKTPLVPFSQAVQSAKILDWNMEIPRLRTLEGIHDEAEIPLSDLIPMIDWKEFLKTWEVDEERGKELLQNARTVLKEIADSRILKVQGSTGLFKCFAPEPGIISMNGTLLAFGRRQISGSSYRSPADYVPPENSGKFNYAGCFSVGCSGVEKLLVKNDDYRNLLVKLLADRLAESAAEYLHLKIQEDFQTPSGWKFIRPAPGYPGCPDHTLKREIFQILGVETKFGFKLTESYMAVPPSAVTGFYFQHPAAEYFAVGPMDDEQLKFLAEKRNFEPEEFLRYLSWGQGI